MRSIGIRELRQHASRWLRLVAEGETFTVTDRGRPVALLSPLREAGWDGLRGSGRLTLPTADIAAIDPLPGDGSSILSDALEDLRRDER